MGVPIAQGDPRFYRKTSIERKPPSSPFEPSDSFSFVWQKTRFWKQQSKPEARECHQSDRCIHHDQDLSEGLDHPLKPASNDDVRNPR
jgi:hypothetical protein